MRKAGIASNDVRWVYVFAGRSATNTRDPPNGRGSPMCLIACSILHSENWTVFTPCEVLNSCACSFSNELCIDLNLSATRNAVINGKARVMKLVL